MLSSWKITRSLYYYWEVSIFQYWFRAIKGFFHHLISFCLLYDSLNISSTLISCLIALWVVKVLIIRDKLFILGYNLVLLYGTANLMHSCSFIYLILNFNSFYLLVIVKKFISIFIYLSNQIKIDSNKKWKLILKI